MECVRDDKPVQVDDGTPVITIEKASDKDTYAVGETGHYTVVVKQTKEDVKAENVVIKDALQTEGAKILAETIRIKDANGEDITEAVKITTTDTTYMIETERDLAYDEAFTVTYDVIFESADLVGKTVVNIAKAKADNAKAETVNEVTPVQIDEGLTAVKSADPEPGSVVKAGDVITYKIAVTNTGNEARTNILVLDEVPAFASYVEGSGGALTSINEHEFISFVIDSIEAGETKDVSFQITVSDSATEEDDIVNTALVKAAENEDPADPSTWVPETFVPTNTVEHPLGNWVSAENAVNIDQGEKARLVVTKTSDKDTYKRKETGTYTITITNDREGTRAENIVVNDAFELTGMAIDKDSVVVKDADGNAIEGAAVTLNDKENGFSIQTGASLDGGKSMTVTYNVKFTDKELVGKDVKNTVTVSSDNTDPADASNTVKIKKAAKKSEDTSKDSSDGKDSKTSNVKTSDVLIVVLIAAVLILLVTVIVYIRRRRR